MPDPSRMEMISTGKLQPCPTGPSHPMISGPMWNISGPWEPTTGSMTWPEPSLPSSLLGATSATTCVTMSTESLTQLCQSCCPGVWVSTSLPLNTLGLPSPAL